MRYSLLSSLYFIVYIISYIIIPVDEQFLNILNPSVTLKVLTHLHLFGKKKKKNNYNTANKFQGFFDIGLISNNFFQTFPSHVVIACV